MMKAFRRILFVILTTLLIGLFCSCKNKQEQGNEDFSNYYLTLNSYNITLYVGDTFTLKPEKVNENGDKKSVLAVYESEAEYIASVNEGVIYANSAGETYVNVTVENEQIACFVTVLPVDEGFVCYIWLNDDTLYLGTESCAKVIAYYNGEQIENFTPSIQWRVSDTSKCSVDNSGNLKALTSEGTATLYADFTYENETYSLEKTISFGKLETIKSSVKELKLATPRTLSGAENAEHVKAEFSVSVLDILSKESQVLNTDAYTVSSTNVAVATVTAKDETIMEITACAVGEASINITVGQRRISVPVQVATAVANVADFDKLAMACYQETALLTGDYMMVSDVDFNGEIIYPIAPFRESNECYAGIQWKYLLTKVDDEYKLLNRAQVGTANMGLSDADFIAFAQDGGINPKTVNFTGVFDGNGYAVKNGLLMYGAYMWEEASVWVSNYSNIFGGVKGTIRNISFENIVQQNPTIAEYDLDRAYLANGTIVDDILKKKGELYCSRAVGVFGRVVNAKLENIYVDVSYTLTTTHEDGILMAYGSNVYANNCVVIARQDLNVLGSRCAFNGLGAKEKQNVNLKNNLALGVNNAVRWMKGHPECSNGPLKGANGNWWTSSLQVQSLFAQTRGSAVLEEEYISLIDTIASFDSTIWDFSTFNTTDEGYPALRNGCSVYVQ